MQYPIIDLITSAYLNNGWTGLDIPQTITYEPVQLGSGDPSPDNVRPILPATTLNIGGVDVPVYGGTLDATTGVLTVDRAEVDAGTLDWLYISDIDQFQALMPMGKEIPSNFIVSNALCSNYKCVAYNDVNTTIPSFGQTAGANPRFRVKDDRFTDAAAFTAAMSGVQFVYELATPITYQLTKTELENIIGIKDDISHRLKLPLPHYFPHPVIDALQRAAAGTQTADDTEILQHYLTPLGIGGI